MGLKDIIVRWLGIVPAQKDITVTVNEELTHGITVLKNKLWYRGDPSELEQFYKQTAASTTFSNTSNTRFWSAVDAEAFIRKLHSGLPRMMVDKLASIVVEDMATPEMEASMLTRWEEIVEDSFDDTLKEAIAKALTEGDGAFKVSVDPIVSQYPLIEFFGADSVDYHYNRGKITEIVFYTEYTKGYNAYKLCEYYGIGYVKYKLMDPEMKKEYSLTTLEETQDLEDVTFSGNYIMAVPMKFYSSAKYKGRGESLFEGKGDMFDAFDEVVSTWVDALRGNRVKQYIPDSLIPRDMDNGQLLKPSAFNPYYIKGSNMTEDAENKVEVIQGEVEFEGLLMSYTTFLDGCLQGILSPSTLGIDVKKLDNAESQREKEKTTMYTRDTLIGTLAKVLPKLVEIVLKTDDNMKGTIPQEKYPSSFEWGQYANPSFEAIVETVGKAKTYGIMSIEMCIDQMYGDSLDEKAKAQEVALLKSEATAGAMDPELEDDQDIVNPKE